MMNQWVEPDLRDQVVDFVTEMSFKTNLSLKFFLSRLNIYAARFYDWRKRYGKVNVHNGNIPRDHWLEEWERKAIVDFYRNHEDDGYRRCTYMMMDQDIVYASASTIYRVLDKAGVIRKWNTKVSCKGDGFTHPDKPHQHWHMDISYVKVNGTFYYFISVLDGFSRAVIHWDLRESMNEIDIGIIQQSALEKYADYTPRFITDNGKQFLSKEFKSFISLKNCTHVTTSPYYPQSNGKLERFHKSLKVECIRRQAPGNIDEAKRIIKNYVHHYNHKRLHSAIAYVTPVDMLNGRQKYILKQREIKLEERRRQRRLNKSFQLHNWKQQKQSWQEAGNQNANHISAEGRSEAAVMMIRGLNEGV